MSGRQRGEWGCCGRGRGPETQYLLRDRQCIAVYVECCMPIAILLDTNLGTYSVLSLAAARLTLKQKNLRIHILWVLIWPEYSARPLIEILVARPVC
jgi:hypothetical protein